VIFSPEYMKETTESEIDILASVVHDNIVLMKDLFITETHYCIVMDLVMGGELFDKVVQLEHYTESKAAELIYQVLEGVAHLHDHGIMHRDLKPQNLLLSSPDDDAIIKIADFGIAVKTGGARLYQACGTLRYYSPELVYNTIAEQNKEQPEGYDMKVDVWAVGVILYILLSGCYPFGGTDTIGIITSIVRDPVLFNAPAWGPVSGEAKRFIWSLLEKSPDKRPTARQALQDSWIRAAPRNVHLQKSVEKLKILNARIKFIGAITAVKVAIKLPSLASLKQIAASTPDTGPPVLESELGNLHISKPPEQLHPK